MGGHARSMVDIGGLVDAMGGFAQKRQLVRRGVRDRHLTNAVKSREVVRVRNGWYSTVPETDLRLRALRVGGRLTGLAAVAQWGGWVLSVPILHVAVPENASRLRCANNRRRRLVPGSSGGVAVHWEPREQLERGSATSVSLPDALYRVVVDEKLEDAIAALDWAMHEGLFDGADLDVLIERLPLGLRWIAEWTDAACESLPESLSRTRLRLEGHVVRSQVVLQSRERIDLVVDDTAAVEVDGRAHHSESFLADRKKDLRITVAGFHALRPAASMVFYHWGDVYRAISCAIQARGHDLPRRVGDSGFGRFGPASRSRYQSRRRQPRARSPEFSTHEV